ncbi:hypothetical protein BDN71DRAFT_1432838 [Pleurotus eryngii]|uniref:Uncharacterized protein n=1 Tax=Pleurotus eryngii TaxID=5323 RepID=A0A9P5ZSG3_PLEER|nr:hypothetical protein BDN71DRAFT_1432838 [Pleurotus eryngii]
MANQGRKLRSGNEFSPYVLDLDFTKLLQHVESPWDHDDTPSERALSPNDTMQVMPPDDRAQAIPFQGGTSPLFPKATPPSRSSEGTTSPGDLVLEGGMDFAADNTELEGTTMYPAAPQDLPRSSSQRATCPTEPGPPRSSFKAYKRRLVQAAQHERGGRLLSTLKKGLIATAVQHEGNLDSRDLPATSDGYSGRRVAQTHEESARRWTVEELRAKGFTLVEWDGW